MALPLPLAFLGLGDSEIMVVMVVILIFFGGKRMPELARGLGKMLKEFRRATGDVEREFKRMMDETERQTIAPLRESMQVPPGTVPTAASVFGNETATTSGAPTIAAPAAVGAVAPAADLAAPPPPASRHLATSDTSGARETSPSLPAWPLPAPYSPAPTHRLQPNQSDTEFHSDI